MSNPIYSICKKVQALTDEQFLEMETGALEQATYMHPLKLATQRRVTAAGRHNLAVLAKLRELRDTINQGKS